MTADAEVPPPKSAAAPSMHEDVPPATMCAWCGRTDCDGCAVSERGPVSSLRQVIPWEERLGARAWWLTCMRVTEPPMGWLETVLRGRLARAAWFALLAEVVAVTSYAAPVVLSGWALMAVLGSASSVWGVLGGTLRVCVGLGAFMVVLHVVWVAALEALLAVRGTKSEWRPALLLGLYACGWDMVTSPGGVVLGWYYGGWSRVGGLLRGATANPRAACLYYLAAVRNVSPAVALRLAMAAAVLAVMLGVVGAAGLLWWWDPELWTTLIAVARFTVE